jgi:hypothetical protein
MRAGRYGLFLVMQRTHKEAMKIKKKINTQLSGILVSLPQKQGTYVSGRQFSGNQ